MPGIRRMVQTDLEQVAVIAAGLFTQPWDRQGFADALPLESACFLVAAEGDKVLGYCGLYMAADEGEVINVAVAKASQGKGMASRLMDALLDEGHARGVPRFFLEVRVSNTPAIKLYEKLNFKVAGSRKGFYQSPSEDALVMQRSL